MQRAIFSSIALLWSYDLGVLFISPAGSGGAQQPRLDVLQFACLVPSCGCPQLLDPWIYEGKTLLEEGYAFLVNPKGILKVTFPSTAEMSTLRSRLCFVASGSLQGEAVDLETVFEEAPYSTRAWSFPSPSSSRSASPGQVLAMRRLLACSALGKLLQPYIPVSCARGDGVANSASSRSCSAYWRVRGKKRSPHSDLRMNSLMERWIHVSDLSRLLGALPVTECVPILMNKALRT